jgi:hypothetical protein
MRNVSDTSCTENQNIHFVLSDFLKSRCLRDNVKKYCIAGQGIDVNMAHAHRMPDT